jgi:hypothetical protein
VKRNRRLTVLLQPVQNPCPPTMQKSNGSITSSSHELFWSPILTGTPDKCISFRARFPGSDGQPKKLSVGYMPVCMDGLHFESKAPTGITIPLHFTPDEAASLVTGMRRRRNRGTKPKGIRMQFDLFGRCYCWRSLILSTVRCRRK